MIGLGWELGTHPVTLKGRRTMTCIPHLRHRDLVIDPLKICFDSYQNTVPTGVVSVPLLQRVMLRENVALVHGHSAYSTLCHEAILTARLLGIPVRVPFVGQN